MLIASNANSSVEGLIGCDILALSQVFHIAKPPLFPNNDRLIVLYCMKYCNILANNPVLTNNSLCKRSIH